MSERYPSELLRELRNEIPIARLIAEVLRLPYKISEGYFRFLCPHCLEFHTATNAETNLARCFRCKENFNPIDLVMVVKGSNFVQAVEFLLDLPLLDGKPEPRRDPRRKEVKETASGRPGGNPLVQDPGGSLMFGPDGRLKHPGKS